MLRKHRLEIILVSIIVMLIAVYVRWAFIPSFAERHVSVSEEKYDFNVGEPGQWFSAWSLGDGQAYVMIALDPTGEKLALEISEAGYRFARAGYGWAGWAVSAGRADLVPYALGAVGALCVIGTLAMAIKLRLRLGPRSWLILANPALYIGFAADTSEPMAILLLTIALGWNSWIAAGLLGVTRPTFLVALWGEWRLLAVGLVAALSLALYSLLAFGADALVPAGGRLAAPLVAYFEHSTVWGWFLGVASLATLLIGLRERDWSWVLAGAFMLCLGSDVLREPVNAWRAAGILPVMWAFGPGYRVASSRRSTGSAVVSA